MEDLFPAKGKVVERTMAGNTSAEWTVDGYIYGLEYMGLPTCDYAGVVVQGSVESEPFFGCIDTSDTTKPTGEAVVTKKAAFPMSRNVTQSGGEYSLASSGPFASHVQGSDGVYHTALHSRGIDATTGEGSHSLVMSVDMRSGATSTAKFTVSRADWCKGATASEPCSTTIAPVVGIAGGKTSLQLLMASRGGIESRPVTHDALGRRYDLYWQTLKIDPKSHLLDPSGAAVRLFGVPDYKAGVPDQPTVGGGLGMTWEVVLYPSTDVVHLLVAPLIPDNDTLSLDLVSVGGASSACNKTWKLYDSASPDADYQPLWLAARAGS